MRCVEPGRRGDTAVEATKQGSRVTCIRGQRPRPHPYRIGQLQIVIHGHAEDQDAGGDKQHRRENQRELDESAPSIGRAEEK